ncbi:GDSL-type esterase/lipase family protein [Ochrovirga pacifica]|uniref:GDSL-type esterase/lipase family protein n=1 Tax=Ochrovirga pacifica TaxID=1042376 RepID=UPI00025583ED|nr:GDSL-type esterase/lipase family protein [Ochrovirga pacifica]
MKQFKRFFWLLLMATVFNSCESKEEFKLTKNQVIACIGDSTTHGKKKGYVEFLQQYVDTNHPDLNLTFLNWGRGAETITGLTEKQYEVEYKRKRPYLFDRLDANLTKAKQKPDIATFCYGINCGNSGVPSKELFEKYQNGLTRFLDRMEQENIKVILMTPPPFSLEVAKQNGWKREPSDHYSWRNPYEKYDEEVIQVFRDIVLQIQHPSIVKKIDMYAALKNKSADCYGKDPIHPNAIGYQHMGSTIAKELDL